MSEVAATTQEVPGEEIKVDPSTTDPQATGDEVTQEELKDDESEAQEERKKKSGFARRAEKLRQQQEELAAERDYWRNLALQSQSPQAPANAEPRLEDFNSVQEFISARDAWLEERLLSKVTNTVKQRTTEDRALEAHNQRVEAAKKEFNDWDDVFDEAGDLDVPPDTAQFVLESEVGPKIAYHLAKNPQELERLNRLSPTRRLAELGKLEDKLAKPVAPKKVSSAPAKLTEVKGGSDLPSGGRPSSFAEWKANRERQAKR